MIKIGLTGSIAMGKSTTADLFRKKGVWVHDSDATVAALYAPGGGAVAAVGAIAPDVLVDGRVDRDTLRKAVREDPTLIQKLEAVVHPLVTQDRMEFVDRAEATREELVVFDVPLLFETGLDESVDVIVVVSAPFETQRKRALARTGMTENLLEEILARQTPDHEKRDKADFVIDTSRSIDDADDQVEDVLTRIRHRFKNG